MYPPAGRDQAECLLGLEGAEVLDDKLEEHLQAPILLVTAINVALTRTLVNDNEKISR
jgi:hypothetical protein